MGSSLQKCLLLEDSIYWFFEERRMMVPTWERVVVLMEGWCQKATSGPWGGPAWEQSPTRPPAAPSKHACSATSQCYQDGLYGCWTDAKTKEGGISTELSYRINHTNSSSYLSIFLFGLCHLRVFIYSGTSPVSQVDSKSTKFITLF